ncbi:hypothetical protein N5T79_04025 [Aliarcobacter cryaerophilus]|uniref:hypothetical protein n=1 Tax=Aliarcobacter cryaerophilus TaxID=28198 RepID=UPI0021B5C2AB|nr:hypothetical protein [Aliarcobacter cryaerophilus]MCT7528300.1 hypothetical protein [Aliarcobacter cryaerophilus]
MISPIQLGKTYGVLHTESFFSFLGFAKKVGSDETQKIDVFLDDKLIDTIEANEFIQKIDDMYDVENKAFKYNLPSEYIGKKAIISFKNHHSGEELLNSPYTLIDKNHEKFNEAKFLHSLNEPISEEIKNMYSPNSIGFLATEENLADEEFVGYIKELMVRFPDVEFKAFCFNYNEKELLKELYSIDIENIIISNITQMTEKINVFIHTINHINLVPNLLKQNICNIWFINNAYNSNLTVKQYDSNADPYYLKNFLYEEKISDNYAINFRNKINPKSNTELLSEIIYFERIESFFKSKEIIYK